MRTRASWVGQQRQIPCIPMGCDAQFLLICDSDIIDDGAVTIGVAKSA